MSSEWRVKPRRACCDVHQLVIESDVEARLFKQLFEGIISLPLATLPICSQHQKRNISGYDISPMVQSCQYTTPLPSTHSNCLYQVVTHYSNTTRLLFMTFLFTFDCSLCAILPTAYSHPRTFTMSPIQVA